MLLYLAVGAGLTRCMVRVCMWSMCAGGVPPHGVTYTGCPILECRVAVVAVGALPFHIFYWGFQAHLFFPIRIIRPVGVREDMHFIGPLLVTTDGGYVVCRTRTSVAYSAARASPVVV